MALLVTSDTSQANGPLQLLLVRNRRCLQFRQHIAESQVPLRESFAMIAHAVVSSMAELVTESLVFCHCSAEATRRDFRNESTNRVWNGASSFMIFLMRGTDWADAHSKS